MRKRKDHAFAERIASKADALGEKANVHYAEGSMRIGEMVAMWRVVHKSSVSDIAKEIGVNVSTIRRLEAGKQKPDGESMIKIIIWIFSERESEQQKIIRETAKNYGENQSKSMTVFNYEELKGQENGTSESASRVESNDREDGQGAGVENLSGGGY